MDETELLLLLEKDVNNGFRLLVKGIVNPYIGIYVKLSILMQMQMI